MLKVEKDKRKAAKMSSKCSDDECKHDQRRDMHPPNSRSAHLNKNMTSERIETVASSPEYHSRDEERNQGGHVANWTNSAHQGADKDLLDKARMYIDVKDKRKKQWSYDLSDAQLSSSDVEIKGKVHLPHDKRIVCVAESCIGKRTRSQFQKAEEELLNIARMLKAERDEKKKEGKLSSKYHLLSPGHHPRDENPNHGRHAFHKRQIPHQKADKEVLDRARMLKNEKDKRKKHFSKAPTKKRSSKDPTKQRSSKDVSDDERSISDIRFLGEMYVPHDQRKEVWVPRSRIAQLHRSIPMEPVDTPPNVMDENQNQGTRKEIGAPSRSNSVTTSSENDLSFYKGENLVLSGDESVSNYCKGHENQDSGRQGDNPRMFYLISSSDEEGSESGDKDRDEG